VRAEGARDHAAGRRPRPRAGTGCGATGRDTTCRDTATSRGDATGR
jgi:hypothetical protein